MYVCVYVCVSVCVYYVCVHVCIRYGLGWVGSKIFMVEMGWVGFSYQNLYIFRYYNYQTDI